MADPAAVQIVFNDTATFFGFMGAASALVFSCACPARSSFGRTLARPPRGCCVRCCAPARGCGRRALPRGCRVRCRRSNARLRPARARCASSDCLPRRACGRGRATPSPPPLARRCRARRAAQKPNASRASRSGKPPAPPLCVAGHILRNPTKSLSPASRSPLPFFAGFGAAYGTAKAGVGIASMGVMRPELVMKSIVPVVMAGVLGIYGLIVAVIIGTNGASRRAARRRLRIPAPATRNWRVRRKGLRFVPRAAWRGRRALLLGLLASAERGCRRASAHASRLRCAASLRVIARLHRPGPPF